MIYFSPGMVFRGARLGVLSGSYITFILFFISSLFIGRIWCGWLCPAGGLCEIIISINNKPFLLKKLKIIKFIIWFIWLFAILIVVTFIGHGFSSIDPFMGTLYGFSVHNLSLLAVYYLVIFTIIICCLIMGKRGFCHSLCWMASFFILGRKLSNNVNIKSLHLIQNDNKKCTLCRQCENKCPMSLSILKMIEEKQMEHLDCILCGECVDICKIKKLNISFKQLK